MRAALPFVTGSLSAFRTSLSNDLVFDPDTTRNEPVPASTPAPNVYVAMRQTDGEVVLVLANFNAEPVAQPGVSAGVSALRAGWPATDESGSTPVAALAPAADGSFQNWVPVAELPGESVTVIRWRQP